jgi:hypothetical protein
MGPRPATRRARPWRRPAAVLGRYGEATHRSWGDWKNLSPAPVAGFHGSPSACPDEFIDQVPAYGECHRSLVGAVGHPQNLLSRGRSLIRVLRPGAIAVLDIGTPPLVRGKFTDAVGNRAALGLGEAHSVMTWM